MDQTGRRDRPPGDGRVEHSIKPSSLVIAVGPLPPPMHGAAAVTAAVWSALQGSTNLVEVDTSPGDRSGARYHLHRLRRHVAAVRAIARHRQRRPRRLYATCPGGPALWYLVAVVTVARLFGYHVVIHHHSFAYLDRASVSMQLLVGLAGARSTHVLLCERMRFEFEDRYDPRGDLIVCSNAGWVSPSGKAPAPILSGRLRLGHLGRLTRAKGLEQVLGTVRGLVERGVDADLRLAGPLGTDADRRLLEAAESDLGGRLALLGPVTGATKDNFFASIDAFVFPTLYRHEAEPLVVLEALAAGVIVVAYGRGCIGGMVLGDAGLVVDTERNFVVAAVSHLAGLARASEALGAARKAAAAAFEHQRGQATKGRRAMVDAIIGSPHNMGGGSDHGGSVPAG